MHCKFVPMLRTALLVLALLGGSLLLATALPVSFDAAHAQGGFSCGDVSEIPNADCLALEALYNATNGNGWTNKTGWLANKTPCSWYGVTCGGGRVTELRLQSNGLQGTLPTALGDLAQLTWLELQFNELTGPIPAELGNLSQLTELSLYRNTLTGSIPRSLGNLSNLNALRLGFNKLNGTIPKELGNLSQLTILGIDTNQLTGPLPTTLENLTNLELFNANDNQLDGTIPPGFGNFNKMWRLWLENNRFTGTLPTELGNLVELKNFSVRNNALTGTIPTSFTNLTKLQRLDLGYNSLSTNDGTLQSFLNSKNPEWVQSQTVAPTNVKAVVQSGGSALVTWSPIAYVGDGGYYEISYATTPTGPFAMHGRTAGKGVGSYTVTGLSSSTIYYFVVRTHTPAHGNQQNALTSVNSQAAMAQTSSFTCGDVSEIPETECNALIVFYNSTQGPNWVDNSSWLTSTTPCSWFGIICTGGRITAIALGSNGLKGALPGELGVFTALQTLDLNHNELNGTIPAQLGNLTALVVLRLPNNQLTGTIPVELANLSNLEELVLSSNYLTGDIPVALGNLSKLTRFVVPYNQLTGTIPSTFGNLKNLRRLALGRNQLGGAIPPEIGNMTALQEFWVPQNKLRDEIPPSLLQLENLVSISIDYNRLWTENTALINLLNLYDPDWAETQTIPPSNVQAAASSANTIKLTWTAIPYQADGGYYEIRYARQSGGPYDVHGVTTSKSSQTYEVTGLQANTRYYFVLRTYTPAFGNQANNLWSNIYSNEASATTQADTGNTPPQIQSTTVDPALRGEPYAETIVTTGSSPLAFALSEKPSGMAIDSNTGLISWTPTQVGTFTFKVKVSNAFGTAERSFSITVNEAPVITSDPVTTAELNQPYAYDVDATGSPAPTFSLPQAPTGMTINANTGLIQWTPSSQGTVDVTVRVANAVGNSEQEFSINVSQVTAPEAPAITSDPVTTAVVDEPYRYEVEATGRPSPQFSLTTAPNGMTINATTGTIAWTPNALGTFNVTVAANSSAGSDSQSFAITVEAAPDGDTYEGDDSCAQAAQIPTNGAGQVRNFHDVGDADWVRFNAEAGKTYIIKIDNIGAQADAAVELYDACKPDPLTTGSNAFGPSVTLEWDADRNADYYIKLQHVDPIFAGEATEYNVAVIEDNVPPSAPKSPRCTALSPTALAIQWQPNPERDVRGYRIPYQGNTSGNADVSGSETTYYELSNLAPNQTTSFRIRAIDYSGNESPPSGEVVCTAGVPQEQTQPSFAMNQPTADPNYTTSATVATFSGTAQDSGGNLSRAVVTNNTTAATATDVTLSGANATFRVEDVPLAIGQNNITVKVIDDVGNESTKSITINRLGESAGAVLIVAGRNETSSLQENINNSANRAYRIFKSAGYSDDDIYYIATTEQQPDGDVNRRDAAASPAAVQNAITTWAQSRVGPGKPLTIYLMDHGFADRFCVDGCELGGHVTPTELNNWLRALESATGVDQVNIIIEACQSGSFLDRFNGTAQDIQNSLSGTNRVVITSTSREDNAYASAQGAYFSDAFFSCLADSGDLKTCFEQGKAAVSVTGVAQRPWMDDNGDGLYTNADGTVAQQRFVTRFFSSVRPTLTAVEVERTGTNGTLTAAVTEGAEEVEVVWAAVYPPGFQEPEDVTINLQVPTVRLEEDPTQPGQYSFTYVNGFSEAGDYRVVFYAQDRLGIHAMPRVPGQVDPEPQEDQKIYLPVVLR